MIKAPGSTSDGRPMLLLGLTGENMTRLMAGEPIMVDTDQLGLPFAGLPSMVVVLIGGKSEDSIAADLHRALGQ